MSEFDDMCENVRENDSDTASVSTSCLTAFRDEHAQMLADALWNNSYVAKLDIHTTHLSRTGA